MADDDVYVVAFLLSASVSSKTVSVAFHIWKMRMFVPSYKDTDVSRLDLLELGHD